MSHIHTTFVYHWDRTGRLYDGIPSATLALRDDAHFRCTPSKTPSTLFELHL